MKTLDERIEDVAATMAGSFMARRRAPGKEWKISRLNVGYQKADDYTVSLKRIEFALERVKLREKRSKRKGRESEAEKDGSVTIERAERTVKPPFEANWLVDEFERFRSLFLPCFLSFLPTEECTESGREEKWTSGSGHKHGDGKSLLISWN